MDSSDLIDRIYEAAIVPELWADALEAAMAVPDAKGGVLLSLDPDNPRSIATADFADTVDEYFKFLGDRVATNKRTAGLMASSHLGFVRDADVLTTAEIESEPLFSEFLIPRGYGFGVATSINIPTGDSFIIHFERGYSDGPVTEEQVTRLDKFRGTFARAALLAARQNFQKAKTITDTMGQLGLPAIAISNSRKIVSANPLLEDLMPHTLQDHLGKFRLTNAQVDALFEDALTTNRFAPGSAGSLPIPATEMQGATILHAIPMRRSAQDIFPGADVILVLTAVDTDRVPSADVLQGLFDLTPAESAVAQQIGKGHSTEYIANKRGLQKSTVRNQLKSIFAKTGTRRQAELVKLITAGHLPKNSE